LQLDSEQSAIPAGVFRQPVIGNHVSTNLGLAHVRQTHGRDLIKTDNFGAFDATVPGYDAVSVIDKDGIGKTKSPDGIGDLSNLLLRVGTGVGRARLQRAHGLIANR
jgi:hypothetical protein